MNHWQNSKFAQKGKFESESVKTDLSKVLGTLWYCKDLIKNTWPKDKVESELKDLFVGNRSLGKLESAKTLLTSQHGRIRWFPK